VDSKQGENKMAITKTIIEDKIEIVGEHKNIQVRMATVIKEGGKELTRSFERKVLECVTSSHDGSSWTHADTDVSGESSEVQGIATAVWTDDIKAAKRTANEATL
jgi:hypothetical protein|tara:strand:+ start:905 stop:1219 length:315 start_codon:yes stop_codon:yes gene_type:complete